MVKLQLTLAERIAAVDGVLPLEHGEVATVPQGGK